MITIVKENSSRKVVVDIVTTDPKWGRNRYRDQYIQEGFEGPDEEEAKQLATDILESLPPAMQSKVRLGAKLSLRTEWDDAAQQVRLLASTHGFEEIDLSKKIVGATVDEIGDAVWEMGTWVLNEDEEAEINRRVIVPGGGALYARGAIVGKEQR